MSGTGTLAGRVAIVTGGARGIGASISRMLVERGARVLVADSGVDPDGRNKDPSVAQQFADQLGEAAHAYTEDMAIPAAAKEAVEIAVDELGGIDIVVNNAAILRDAFVFKGSTADWDEVIRNNLSAAYYLTAAATPIMRDNAKDGRGAEAEGGKYLWGRIVNIVSTAGFYGNYGQAAYASAKGGLTALMRTTALDMARSGVTCNAVAPFARTRVTEMIQPANEAQEAYKERALKVPAGHVANLVGFLCTPAAQGISGQILGVRGREVFVFQQPRPAARIVTEEPSWADEALAEAVERELAPHFAALETDLEAFNSEPFV